MSRPPDLLAKISLLRAAEEVFAEKGVTDAKVEEITRRAGLSKGAFYLHFASKDEAFREVVESFLARCHQVFCGPEGIAEDTLRDPAAIVDFAYEREVEAFEFLWQNRAFLQIVEGCTGTHAYLLDAFLAAQEASTRDWCRFWKEWSVFRPDVDEELCATLLVGAYRALVRKMLRSSVKPPLRRWVAEAQSFVLRGLGAPRVGAACQARHPSETELSRVRPKSAARRTHGSGRK
jgi:AcrR family transcriptional regulator